MKIAYALALALLGGLSTPALASPWTSLGRLNGLTTLPDVNNCEQRLINHYWSSAPIFTPTMREQFSSSNIVLGFSQDISSLFFLTSNSVSLSRFATATNFYSTITTPKSLYATLSLGTYTNLSIEVSYLNSSNLVQGNGWGIDPSELQYYELQQHCPI